MDTRRAALHSEFKFPRLRSLAGEAPSLLLQIEEAQISKLRSYLNRHAKFLNPFAGMASRDSIVKAPNYSRKEKSLGLLCTNFLRLYNRRGVDSIGVDDAALQLGVKIRRIYDIVNVLEGIGVLQKRAKGQYTWKGFGAIFEVLKVLKEQGLKEEFYSYTTNKERKLLSGSKSEWPDKCSELDKGGSTSTEHRTEKSLVRLTQNFVKLLIRSDVDMISLDDAASAFLGYNHHPTARKTKLRRLYDVANVLLSAGLVEKVYDPNSRKPAFRWMSIGRRIRNGSPTAYDIKNCKRVFEADITNTNPSNEQHQKHGSKKFEFGPFAPNLFNSKGYETRNGGQIQNWDNLFCSYQPDTNKAIGDLFQHYAEARNWLGEVKGKQKI